MIRRAIAQAARAGTSFAAFSYVAPAATSSRLTFAGELGSLRCISSGSDSAAHVGHQESVSSAGMTPDQRRGMINMMLYRAKQRGFLELDLLMGMYAEKHIPTMSDEKLIAFNELLLEENPDLFKWLTGQLQPPEEVADNIAYKDIRTSIASKLGANSQSVSLAQPGTEWIRGWTDSGEELKDDSSKTMAK